MHKVRRIRRQAGRRVERPGQTGKRQGRRRARLLAAGAVFVLLTALRLASPQLAGELSLHLRRSMSQRADFKAAFSAVGEAVAGERELGESLEEAYTAVFAPEDYRAQRAAEVFAAAQEIQLPAARLAQRVLQRETAQEDPAAEETVSAELTQVWFGTAPPDNVSFSQQVLGFAYTTPARGKLTSSFGYREHPIYGQERFHYGLDIAGATGTEIVAFAAGKVTVTGESSSLGEYLMIDHGGGYTSLYAHCDRVTARSGREVRAGEKVAEMGSSGNTTGPHLHFELLRGNTYLNPIYYVETA